jgi:soluble lytic murein transglycosylase-like protein
MLLEFVRTALTLFAAITSLKPDLPAHQAAEFSTCIASAAAKQKVPASLVAAVIHRESQWRHDAVSSTNDYGLGQIHCPSPWCATRPSSAELAQLLDPCSNIHMTAEFLATRGLRAYNPGSPAHAQSVRRIAARIGATVR